MDGSVAGLNEFDITRSSPSENSTIHLYFAAVRGQAIMRAAGDSGVVANERFQGFLTRDVTAEGPGLADHFYPGRPALAFKVGDEASLNYADEFEAEGETFLQLSGSGALDENVAIGTKLTPHAGKWGETQEGETAFFEVTAVLDPVNSDDNDFRIRAEKLHI